jgi:hypothetical protein
MWLNEYDVNEAVCRIEIRRGVQPNRYRAALVLAALVEWTNSHSDGWPYWAKPSRASTRLQEIVAPALLGRGLQHEDDITAAEVDKALVPVKAFLTRQRVSQAERDTILRPSI